MLNIIIPMAGKGSRFQEAGFAFPKPLIDINGQTMIEVVIKNLKPTVPHRFVFICQKEHYEKYDLHNIFKNATDNNFEVVQIHGATQGAACTVLCAASHINTDEDILIANSDQFIEFDVDEFIATAREGDKDGLILTFNASHPKWSYARIGANNRVLEVAEKKVISNNATVGLYYFRKGSDFVRFAQDMIRKGITYNNEFYVCPVYNEAILNNQNIYIQNIEQAKMHGLGTPEDLAEFLAKLKDGTLVL